MDSGVAGRRHPSQNRVKLRRTFPSLVDAERRGPWGGGALARLQWEQLPLPSPSLFPQVVRMVFN